MKINLNKNWKQINLNFEKSKPINFIQKFFIRDVFAIT